VYLDVGSHNICISAHGFHKKHLKEEFQFSEKLQNVFMITTLLTFTNFTKGILKN